VTLEAKGEPLLKVLDRACLARGDVTFDIAEGKVRVAAGTHRNSPTAYVGAFRARLKRVAVYESNDFGDRRTDLVLYLHVDAQPDQKCCSVCATSAPPGGGPAGGGLPFKAASESPLATWMSERSGRTVLLIDEVPVILEEGDRIDGIYVLKGAPAGLKVLPSLRLRALYRFAVGSVSTRVPLVTGKLSTESGGLPFYIQNSGRHVFITSLQRVGREPSRPLEELVELDSFVVLDKEGKEISLTNQTVAPPGFRPQFRYQLVADGDLKGEGLTIRFNLIDAVERDVEFELKDVKLRD
jgi:hypothetical protein